MNIIIILFTMEPGADLDLVGRVFFPLLDHQEIATDLQFAALAAGIWKESLYRLRSSTPRTKIGYFQCILYRQMGF